MDTEADWEEFDLLFKPDFEDVKVALHSCSGCRLRISPADVLFFPESVHYIDKGASVLFSGYVLARYGLAKERMLMHPMRIEYQFQVEVGNLRRTTIFLFGE